MFLWAEPRTLKNCRGELHGVLGVHGGSRTYIVCAPGGGREGVLCSAHSPAGASGRLGPVHWDKGFAGRGLSALPHAGLKFAPRFS